MDVAVVAQKKQKVVIDLDSDNDVSAKEHGLTIRGPGIVGDDDDFDPFCVFPHKVELTQSQVQFLKDRVKKKEPTIPFYVCAMKKSTVMAKAKMVFSKDYSKCYLSHYLSRYGDYVEVFDKSKGKDNEDPPEVIMKIGKGKPRRAIITTGWGKVVDSMKIKQGTIYMFWFRRIPRFDGTTTLKLILKQVQ